MDHAKFMLSTLNGIRDQSRKAFNKTVLEKKCLSSIWEASTRVLNKYLFIVSDRGVKQSSPGRKEDKTDGQVKTDTIIWGIFVALV